MTFEVFGGKSEFQTFQRQQVQRCYPDLLIQKTFLWILVISLLGVDRNSIGCYVLPYLPNEDNEFSSRQVHHICTYIPIIGVSAIRLLVSSSV